MTTVVRWQPNQCLVSRGTHFHPGSIPVELYLRKVRAGIVSATRTAQGLEKEVCSEVRRNARRVSCHQTRDFAMSLRAMFRRVLERDFNGRAEPPCISTLVARIRWRNKMMCLPLYNCK